MLIRFRYVVLSSLGLLVALQLVPYGRDHANPPVLGEPAWDAHTTRELARSACFDCHSNETAWPWYSHVAPFSWIVQRDVEHGRAALNFSEWPRLPKEAVEALPSLRQGDMPPAPYRRAHAVARLSDRERLTLGAGLARTLSGLNEFQASEPGLPADQAGGGPPDGGL